MELNHEKNINEFRFSTDKKLLDINYIHRFLSERSYWAEGIPIDFVRRSIENSLCVGIYQNTKQVGFARLVTDFATFGYLADVFVDETFRGKGLSKQLMEFIFSFEELKFFRRMILATKDAHGLYSRYGFTLLKNPDRFMERAQPGIYKQMTSTS